MLENSVSEISPWCSLCDNGFMKVKKESSLGYNLVPCQCSVRASFANDCYFLCVDSWLPNETILSYLKKPYKEIYLKKEQLLWWLRSDKDKKQRLYLYGTTWTGKTHVAMVLFVNALVMWMKALYTNVPELMDRLRPWNDSKEDYMESCKHADLLILDDLGQEKPSERVLERLYIIINSRYMSNKKTVITSNCSIHLLGEIFNHPAIISRIQWASAQVPFWGDDLRTNPTALWMNK